jgi:hypothetical protein
VCVCVCGEREGVCEFLRMCAVHASVTCLSAVSMHVCVGGGGGWGSTGEPGRH